MPYTLEPSPNVDFTNKDDKAGDDEIQRTCPTNGKGVACHHRDMENRGEGSNVFPKWSTECWSFQVFNTALKKKTLLFETWGEWWFHDIFILLH